MHADNAAVSAVLHNCMHAVGGTDVCRVLLKQSDGGGTDVAGGHAGGWVGAEEGDEAGAVATSNLHDMDFWLWGKWNELGSDFLSDAATAVIPVRAAERQV